MDGAEQKLATPTVSGLRNRGSGARSLEKQATSGRVGARSEPSSPSFGPAESGASLCIVVGGGWSAPLAEGVLKNPLAGGALLEREDRAQA